MENTKHRNMRWSDENDSPALDDDRRRFWFSPNPFYRFLEILSGLAFLLYLSTFSVTGYFIVYALTADSQDYNGLGAAIGAGIFSRISLLLFGIAHVLVLIYYCCPNFTDTPKGMIFKILYFASLATIPVVLWVCMSP